MTPANDERLLPRGLAAIVTAARDRRRAEETRRAALTVAESRLRKIRHFAPGASESTTKSASRFVDAIAAAASAISLAVDPDAIGSLDVGECDDEVLVQIAVVDLCKQRLSITRPDVDADSRRLLELVFAELLDLEVDLGAFPRRLLAVLPGLADRQRLKTPRATKRQDSLRRVIEAAFLIQQHPESSDAAIAREVGVTGSTLSRNDLYKRAAAMARGNPSQDRPGLRGGPRSRGRKPKRNDD